MFERKSLALFISLFGSSAALAAIATPTNNNVFHVTVPALKPGFEVNVSALFLKPSASNLNYAIYNKELPAQSPSWTEKELDPGYDAAFEVGARYIFPHNVGNDISFTWTHLNSNTNASIAAPNASFFIGPDYEIGPDSTSGRAASGSVNFKYDVVNLDVGQFVDFGQHVQMRFFGGVSGGFLRENVKSTFTGNVLTPPFTGPFSMTSSNYANFSGAGPRFGFDMNYNMDNGFGFLGEAAVSALIGVSHARVDFTSSAPELLALYGQAVNNQDIVDENNTQVIPAIDAKLGVNYKYAINPCSLFTVELGYTGAVYINAINQYAPASLVTGAPLESGGIFVATMAHTQSNYAVQGPFLKFAYQFS